MPPGPGHNRPPSALEIAQEAVVEVSKFVADHPRLQTEEEARQAKLLFDRTRSVQGDLEAYKDRRVKPLYQMYVDERDAFREPLETIASAITTLRGVIGDFIQREEARKAEEAEAARRAAEEARKAAEEAKAKALDAIDSASQGEVGVDIVGLEQQVRDTTKAAKKLERVAKVADRDANVRIGGGFKRSSAMREYETFHVIDLQLAIADMIDNQINVDEVKDLIAKMAKAFNKLKGRPPKGISIVIERRLS